MTNRQWLYICLVAVFFAVSGLAYVGYRRTFYYTIERTEYSDPRPDDGIRLVDDNLADKKPEWNAALVDSRPVGDWELNASAAVMKLDCPSVKPDYDAWMLDLKPSYAAAVAAAESHHRVLLPSANMLDGAAKQFDDGLYAAVDLACYRGELGLASAPPDLAERVFRKLRPGSPARPFFSAALSLAGRQAPVTGAEARARKRYLADFERDESRSKPISFYNWTGELKRLWRFMRFLQREFYDQSPDVRVARDTASALAGDAGLLSDYRKVNAFYGRLTNPLICMSMDRIAGRAGSLAALAREQGTWHQSVAFFPPSASRETELFERLFGGTGIPPGVNLMAELIHRIRSGDVDLAPGEKSGWYQHQAYALETMLLPSRGREKDKLQLTAKYKRRLVEAFKALITKRRETHARQLAKAGCPSAAMPLREAQVRPRLRIEPCPTFYLRTARAYDFVRNLLVATAGEALLRKMHGLRRGGEREAALAEELASVRLRFYGFYLIACEDIGMRPQFLRNERVDVAAARGAAEKWLGGIAADRDLECDTRVSIPIAGDPVGRVTRIWATLGVRLAHLDASYALPPKVRPKGSDAEWKEVERWQLGLVRYAIAVDEFAEIEMKGLRALTRAELRAVCDKHKTKDGIVEALSSR